MNSILDFIRDTIDQGSHEGCRIQSVFEILKGSTLMAKKSKHYSSDSKLKLSYTWFPAKRSLYPEGEDEEEEQKIIKVNK